MDSITFIDTEIDARNKKVLDIGSVKDNGDTFHSNFTADFVKFLRGTRFICGHNIIHHDLKFIQDTLEDSGIKDIGVIDTLHLSPLLFPAKPYHALLKDDKLQTEELNNPLNDAIKARDLFYDELAAFRSIDDELKHIFYGLLNSKKEFCSFFDFIGYKSKLVNIEELIRKRFDSAICAQANISPYPKNPVIAKFFKEIERVDELGSGVRNTFKYCGIYTPGTHPEFIEEDIFKTIIPLKAKKKRRSCFSLQLG